MGAADLAEALRELKERSGLSYGALAKQLHMSTSTLHRYVQGAAVPTEFAPLERFARVCGASREDAVEIHRRWVRADASRGDRKEGEPSAAVSARVPSPAADDQSPAAAECMNSPAAEPATGDDFGDEVPGVAIGPRSTGVARRGGRRPPRARVLVAAGVVVALAATAVVVQAASGGGERGHAAVEPSGPQAVSEGHGRVPGGSASSSVQSGKGVKPDEGEDSTQKAKGKEEGKGK
ncbi:helix-turn-helix domain-containing protein, partial [Streptomyces flavofungini]|uniref:helix-turn-helix domain-containing protein n=1 Tax=Streptomyces flavofungini TaxID=68200 RepID=UPI0034DEAAE6